MSGWNQNLCVMSGHCAEILAWDADKRNLSQCGVWAVGPFYFQQGYMCSTLNPHKVAWTHPNCGIDPSKLWHGPTGKLAWTHCKQWHGPIANSGIYGPIANCGMDPYKLSVQIHNRPKFHCLLHITFALYTLDRFDWQVKCPWLLFQGLRRSISVIYLPSDRPCSHPPDRYIQHTKDILDLKSDLDLFSRPYQLGSGTRQCIQLQDFKKFMPLMHLLLRSTQESSVNMESSASLSNSPLNPYSIRECHALWHRKNI